MILYFEDNYGRRRELARPEILSEALESIERFLEEHNYKAPYVRTWIEFDEMVFDIGSHSEFFFLYNPEGWPSDTLAKEDV